MEFSDQGETPMPSPPSPPRAHEVTASSPARKALPVAFIPEAASTTVDAESLTAIYAAGRGSRAPPRTSKKIAFLDDGKLFEGHLTVQSRNLKAIMQYLVDRQAEQSVIIDDLQHQMQVMRSRHAKKRRLGALGYGAGAGANLESGSEALEQRVIRLENFVRLWGVRPEDVDQLVKDYGDPVITPEPYTAYLMDLAAFRTARREAHALLTTTTGRPSITRASVVSANDTGARRAARQAERSGSDATSAQHALEMASEALRRLDALAVGTGGDGGRKGRQEAAAAPPSQTSSTVDTQARQDIAELGNYVMDRFRELEMRDPLTANAGASVPSRKANTNSKSKGAQSTSSTGPVTSSAPGVDEIAREDAAASLEMIGELEAYVEKRFKELATAIANVALRKNTAPPSAAATTAPAEAPEPASAARKGKKNSRPASPASPPVAPAQPQASTPSSLPVVPMGPLEDTVAREETVVLHERLDDLEGELNTRFQAFEERLRIVGRASMQPRAAGSSGTGPSIDRKAREDASMSLMRVQQLERELTALKRQLAALPSMTSSAGTGAATVSQAADDTGSNEPLVTLAPPADLKDTYNARVQDLEKEVAQRMAEVNRAISMLKSTPSSDPSQQSLLDLLAGQTLFSQAAVASPLPATNTSQNAPGSLVEQAQNAPSAAAANPSINAEMGDAPASTSSGTTADRHTLVLHSHGMDATDADLFLDAFPDALRNVAGVPRRVTVSRLRPPDAPLMGMPLVERDLDVDRLLAELAAPSLPARHLAGSPSSALGSSAAVSATGAATSPTAGAAAEAGDDALRHTFQLPSLSTSAKSTASPTKSGPRPGAAAPAAVHFPGLPPSPPPSTGHRSPVPAVTSATVSVSARRPTATAALGHTKPCVILNCAWCAAEKQSARSATV